MPVVRRKAVPLQDFKDSIPLVGAINGSNTVFTTPDVFIHIPSGLQIKVYYNGQRIFEPDDFSASESGGAGTGFDTITLLFAPKSGDRLDADYVIDS